MRGWSLGGVRPTIGRTFLSGKYLFAIFVWLRYNKDGG